MATTKERLEWAKRSRSGHDREKWIHEFVNCGRFAPDVAQEAGVSSTTIHMWTLKLVGSKRRPKDAPRRRALAARMAKRAQAEDRTKKANTAEKTVALAVVVPTEPEPARPLANGHAPEPAIEQEIAAAEQALLKAEGKLGLLLKEQTIRTQQTTIAGLRREIAALRGH